MSGNLEAKPNEEIIAGRRIVYQFCGSADMNGGVQDSINTLAGYMSTEEGVDTSVFVGGAKNRQTAEEVFDSFEPDRIHILSNKDHFLTSNGSQNFLPGAVKLPDARQLLEEVKPDIVHIMAPWWPWVGGRVLRSAQEQGIATVATYHIYSKELRTNLSTGAGGLWNRKQISRLDAMIAVSEPAEEHLRHYYGYKGKVEIVPNAIDISKYEHAQPFDANEPFHGFRPDQRQTIVFVGRPDERKGLDKLIEAASVLQRRNLDFQMIICGSGPNLDDYKTQARGTDGGDKIKFMGKVSEADKARWLASANLAVFPAKGGESQGIVLLEAMAAGAGVVIGGRNRGYQTVLGRFNMPSEVMFDPLNATELADTIEILHNNQSMARIIHKEQQDLVRSQYDIRAVGRKITGIYQSLV